MSETNSVRPSWTREHLIQHYVAIIRKMEARPDDSVDRNYLLDLVDDVARSIDGRRGDASAQSSGTALAQDEKSGFFRPRRP